MTSKATVGVVCRATVIPKRACLSLHVSKPSVSIFFLVARHETGLSTDNRIPWLLCCNYTHVIYPRANHNEYSPSCDALCRSQLPLMENAHPKVFTISSEVFSSRNLANSTWWEGPKVFWSGWVLGTSEDIWILPFSSFRGGLGILVSTWFGWDGWGSMWKHLSACCDASYVLFDW